MQGQHEQDQEQEQDTEDIIAKMAAAAVYPAHMAGGDSTSAMGQHNFQGSQSQGVLFGETNFLQWGEFEEQMPSDQPPILNHTDQDLLAEFFSDPNSTTQSLIPYDVGFAGVQNSGFPASQAKSHVNGFSGPAGAMTNSHELDSLNAADFTAAQTINGFKAPATWGAFSMPLSLQPNNLDMSSHGNQQIANNRHLSMMGNQRQQYIAQAAPSSIPFGHPSYQSNSYEQPPPPPAQYEIPSRHRNPSLSGQNFMNTTHHHHPPGSHYTASQVTGPQHVHSHSMPQVNYGSDANFSTNGTYQGHPDWHSEQEKKRNNLLGIPLAGPASDPSVPPVQQSMPSQGRGGAGSHWGNTPPTGSFSQSGGADQGRDRKRRQSQMEESQGAEWSPAVQEPPNSGRRSSRPSRNEESSDDEVKSAAKRRRFGGYVRPTGVPKSPTNRHRSSTANIGELDDGIGGRAAKKARETLSEQQKREHHIESEKKRREIINRGYNDLNTLVPCLNNGKSGLSRAECLQEVASYIETLEGGTRQLMAAINLTDQDLIGPPRSASTSAPAPPAASGAPGV